MDNVLALTVGDLVKPKTIKWLFLALTSENQDWLLRNQNNMSEWRDMSIQWTFSKSCSNIKSI
jgi:hypothetical protein